MTTLLIGMGNNEKEESPVREYGSVGPFPAPAVRPVEARLGAESAMPTVYFEDLELGSVHLGRECVCDESEMLDFSRRNDPWPFHVDEAAAASSPFRGLVASGGYIVALWYRSLVEIYNTPTAIWAFLGAFEWKLTFRAPVRAADTVRARVTVRDKRLWIKPGQGVVTLFNEILNQRSEVVCTVEVKALMATRKDNGAPDS